MVQKAQRKAEARQVKQAQQKKKQQKMRVLIWGIAAVFVVLIAAAVIFQPKAGPIEIAYDKVPTLGKADAPVKIAEFGDFKCPTCQWFAQDIMSQIKKEYVDTGKASFSFLNYMIISPTADSRTAALAAQSVYHQNKDEFWKYYDAIYANQQDEGTTWATTDFLVDLAKSSGVQVDYDKLRHDIENETYKDEIDEQTKLARKKNFSGTPTVLINGVKLDDKTALNYNNLKAEIEKAIKESGSGT